MYTVTKNHLIKIHKKQNLAGCFVPNIYVLDF